MREDRFGSYSMAATFAGMLCLSRLKSIRRNICLCPPPRCRHVMRPRALRPPVFLSGTSRDFSGVRLVTSSKVATLWNRRPGDVGRYFLTGIALRPSMIGFNHPGTPSPPLPDACPGRAGSLPVASAHGSRLSALRLHALVQLDRLPFLQGRDRLLPVRPAPPEAPP